MTAPVQDIAIDQGATFKMQLVLKDADTMTAIDISDYSFIGAIRQTFYDTASYPFRFEVIDAVNGVVQAILDANVAESIDFLKGVYDIEFILVDGQKYRLVQGAVVVSLGGLG